MEKIWLSQYQKGVPHEINPDEYPSLVAVIDESCKKFSKDTAFQNMGTEITYAELDSLVTQFASFLQQKDLKKGARVAIMMPNLLQYPVVLFGILRGGYVAVNTNPLYTPDELVHQINDSGAEILIVLANFAKTVETALPRMPGLKTVIVTEIGDLFPWAKRIIVNTVVKYIKKMVPDYHIPQAITFREALKIGATHHFEWVKIDKDDLAFLQYTGGTTGTAKGAMLTHGNMVANILQAKAWITPMVGSEREIVVTALPLYHIFSLTANCLTFIMYGAKNILITNPRDISSFIKQIKHAKFTVITGVNTLFNALLNNPEFAHVDFSKLKMALSGGMALMKSVSVKWQQITQSPVLEAYGLTETSPAVTINPLNLASYNGSIGLPVPSTDVSIRDDDEMELPLGESGEFCIKGPQVMRGYWNQPLETAQVFTKDGFLKTGDIARISPEGYVYLVDRKKDLIIVSGFNIYPNEIEQVLGAHPDVLEVGVVGVKDENGNEQVKACVVKRNPELTAEALRDYSRQHLTAYKVPKFIEFYESLPKTNVGKIMRRALRNINSTEVVMSHAGENIPLNPCQN